MRCDGGATRPGVPSAVPEAVAAMMQDAWRHAAVDRPSFDELCGRIASLDVLGITRSALDRVPISSPIK